MSEISETCAPLTCEIIPNVISLPESAAGLSRYDSRLGPIIARYGLEAVLANLSASQAKEAGLLTSGISGPHSTGLSRSAGLQSSLESRLRARMAGSGSPLFALIWKHWDMPAGEPICALRASGRRTSDSGSTGWPTPKVSAGDYQYGKDKKKILNLSGAAQLTGWATPTSRDHKDGASTLENTPINSLLGRQVSLASWATPQARDHFPAHSESYVAAKKAEGHGMANLNDQASGLISNGSPAPTEKRGQLNPEFSLWLMGFPTAWASCGARVTRSSRNSRRRS